MKKMSKMLSIFCVTCLMGVVAAGCGSENEAGGSSSTGAENSGKAADSKSPVTFNIFMNAGIPEYPENGGEAKAKVIQQMEKAGIQGVDYKVSLLAGDEFKTKLNLLASSGELPDYFSVDSTTLAQYVNQGLVKPLDELLAKAPHLMKVVPKERWEGVKFDGKIYAIPYGVRAESFNSPNVSGLLLRQDWLDNLGLKKPTTLDELHDVLKAFSLNDPDKNGQKDTYGLGGNKMSMFSSIFGAFGVSLVSPGTTGPVYWTERDGKIVKSFVLPEAKQALSILQSWYKEGLIDPEFLVMEIKQGESRIVNSKIGAYEGDVFHVDPKGHQIPEALVKATPTAKLTMVAPPLGPNGKQGMPEVNPFAGGSLRAVSAKAKDPERLMKMLDWSVSEETDGGINLVTYGEENVDYTFDPAKNLITQKSTYTELYKKGFSNPIRFVQVTDRRWTNDAVRGALDISSKYLLKNALWKTVPAELDYPDLEKKLWTEYFVKIVTGVWSIDKFDEFVQKYYQQGGQKIEQQANELWKKG